MQDDKRRYRPRAEPISDLVNRVVQGMGLSRATEHRRVFEAWDAIVPPEFQGRCHAASFRSGKLIVAVESSPLLEELRCYRASEFIQLLNERLVSTADAAHVVVRNIEFRRN
jgi:hypothetical protein